MAMKLHLIRREQRHEWGERAGRGDMEARHFAQGLLGFEETARAGGAGCECLACQTVIGPSTTYPQAFAFADDPEVGVMMIVAVCAPCCTAKDDATLQALAEAWLRDSMAAATRFATHHSQETGHA